MRHPTVSLRALTRADLPVIRPWFEDPDTRRFLGGPDWPASMLEHSVRAVGTTFRGATQIGAHQYLAFAAGIPVGYIDCGTFDCCTLYGGESADRPFVLEAIDAITGSIAFAIDPAHRRQRLATNMIRALLTHPDVITVQLFEAGVEPGNHGSRNALEAAGFELRSPRPDFEGMLYYRVWRHDRTTARTGRRR
ncbi:MAG: GNAT family N-acetyltransferase [Solirubrobacteraceae bacterium]